MCAGKKQNYSCNTHLPKDIRNKTVIKGIKLDLFCWHLQPLLTHWLQASKDLPVLNSKLSNSSQQIFWFVNCRNNYRFDKNNCRSDKKKFKDSILNNQKYKIPVSISWWGSIVPSFCASFISLDYQDKDCSRQKGETSSPCPIIRQERMYFFFPFISILPQSQSTLCNAQKNSDLDNE